MAENHALAFLPTPQNHKHPKPRTAAAGVVVAVKGHPDASGHFQADEVCFIGAAPQRCPAPAAPEDKYVALVSGLGLGKQGADLFKVSGGSS